MSGHFGERKPQFLQEINPGSLRSPARSLATTGWEIPFPQMARLTLFLEMVVMD
jgi:hypothetical protein